MGVGLREVAALGIRGRDEMLGDLTIQGNLKGLPSITEPLQVAVENGAMRVLVPISNKSQFTALPEEVVEKLDVIFYGDVDRAVVKAIEL